MNAKEKYEELAAAAGESKFAMEDFNAATDELWNSLTWFQKFCFNLLSKINELIGEVSYKIDQRKLVK